MRSSRYSTLLRILLGLIVVAGLAYWYAGVRDQIEMRLHAERHARNPFDFDSDTRKITDVEPEATQAGLQKGFLIEALNGVPYAGQAQYDAIGNTAGPGERLEVGFRRTDGSQAVADITLIADARAPGAPSGMGTLLRQSLLFFLLPLLCMLIGYWVVFAKPAEPNAWLLLVLLCFPEVVFANSGLSTGVWELLRGIYYQVLQFLGPLALLPFAIYFPERSRIDAKLPWLKWLILGLAFAGGIVAGRALWGQYYLGGNPPWVIRAHHWAYKTVNFLNLLCVILYFIIIFDKLRTASTQDAKRRLRVLLTGTGIGLTSLLVAFVLLPDLGYPVNDRQHVWLAYIGAALFMLAPLTLAYVVLVQRAMDVRILLRTGTKYALARATLWVVQIVLIVVVALRLLVPLLTQNQVTSSEVWQSLILLTIALLLRSGFSRRTQAWLDKRFFRETYDTERVLNELSAEVRKFTDAKPLLETVARCVAETLHVEQIGMLLRGDGNFKLSQAVGLVTGGNGTLALAGNSSTIRNLTNTNAPALLYRDDPEAWYLMADEAERQVLDTLDTELLLPLSGTHKLMGVMALGPKLSEAAYSKSDLHLLQTLATQTGLALEVSELAHSLAREAAQRERVNREIEIAREVQERLFPQAMPAVPGATVAGACRPAQGVGGDYYDLIPLQDGRLGIAIGDVSGKGISAALLMASLRASLRGVALDNPRNFARLMDKVNRLVYEASADNRYATFFFGAYDATTQMLECVNAGHNAPLVLRQNGDGAVDVLRLEADGPVVGLLPFAPYSEQSLQLQPGDLMIAYTDGISEAMTRDDEEWGEDRMIAAAAAVNGSSAKDVLVSMFAAADAFTAGAPQHDDMTLLILKLDGSNSSPPCRSGYC